MCQTFLPSTDAFNLVGLSPYIPYYEYALDLITDREAEEDLTVEQRDIIEADADNLYGLIHARYILTNRGLQKMVRFGSLLEATVCVVSERCVPQYVYSRAVHPHKSRSTENGCVLACLRACDAVKLLPSSPVFPATCLT